jgi:hypothetical protein
MSPVGGALLDAGFRGFGAEGLFEHEDLVVDERVGQGGGFFRLESVDDRLDRLEGTEEIYFLVLDSVLESAQAAKGLETEAPGEDDFPAEAASTDFCSGE